MTTTKDQATLLNEWQDAANAWRVARGDAAFGARAEQASVGPRHACGGGAAAAALGRHV